MQTASSRYSKQSISCRHVRQCGVSTVARSRDTVVRNYALPLQLGEIGCTEIRRSRTSGTMSCSVIKIPFSS